MGVYSKQLLIGGGRGECLGKVCLFVCQCDGLETAPLMNLSQNLFNNKEMISLCSHWVSPYFKQVGDDFLYRVSV